MVLCVDQYTEMFVFYHLHLLDGIWNDDDDGEMAMAARQQTAESREQRRGGDNKK